MLAPEYVFIATTTFYRGNFAPAIINKDHKY